MKQIKECHLYGIIDTGYIQRDHISTMTHSLLRGGADVIQLRAKKQTRAEVLAMALEIAPICKHAGIAFILNDHPDLVIPSGADGAHVGQDDLPVAEARRLAGPGAIIGKSTHSREQAFSSTAEAPDYIGFGPLFSTLTKPDYTPVGTKEIKSVEQTLAVPVFCIGGINLANLPQVLQAGATRVVIVSDLLLSENPESRTAACKKLLGH